MPQSVSIQKPDGVLKIDFGTFSISINSFVDVSVFRKLAELTIRNTNLITFIDGFYGQSLNLTNATGNPILFISGNSLDSNINQKIIGTGSVRKIGTGKLSLKGVNTYTGNTEILEGVLEITTGSLGNGNYSGNIINSAQISFLTPTQQTLSGIISGSGIFSVSGDVILNKNNTYTGQTSIIAGGKLLISLPTFLDLTTSAIANSGQLTLSGAVNIRIPAPISGTGDLIKDGTGRSFLSGTNVYSGKTEILNGVLVLEKIVSLYNGQSINWTKDKIIINSGGTICFFVGGTGEFTSTEISTIAANLLTSILNNGFKAGSSIGFDTRNSAGGTFTLSSVISDSTGTGAGSVGFQKLGSNTLVVSGTNTFTGEVFIIAGVLSISNFNLETQNGPLGPGTLPIKIGSATEGELLYTGASASSNKKIFFDNQGGSINISTLATTLIMTGVISGSGKFRKLGSGSIELSAANTFSGNLLIAAGIVRPTSSSSLGASTSNVLISSGATLEIINNTSFANNISAEGLGVSNGGAIRNVSGSNVLQGSITSIAGLRIGCFAGNLNIQGSLTSGSSGNIDFRITNALSAITVEGLISGATDILVGTTNGTLVLLNDSNSYTGRLQVADGNCVISSIKNYSVPSSVGASSIGAIQIGNAATPATLIYIGAGDSSNRTIQIGRSITNTVGETGGAIIKANGTGTLAFTGVDFNTQVNVTTGVGANRTLTLAGTGQGVISGIIKDNRVTAPATGTATISIVKSEAGTWTLSGANTFTGPTSINAGYLIISNAAALGTIATATTVNSGGSLKIQGGISLAAEPFTISGDGAATDGAICNNSGNNTITGAITLALNSRIRSAADTLTISGAISGATRTLTIDGDGNISISGIITLTTGGITKLGQGTLILSGINSYTGATAINFGAIRILNSGALGTTNPVIAANGQLELSGAMTFARSISISGQGVASEGAFINRSGANTMSATTTLAADSTIACIAGTLTISGGIAGVTRTPTFDVNTGAEIVFSGATSISTGGIIKTGPGILSLSGSNTLTGEIGIFEGTFRIRIAGSLGTSSKITVYDGATFAIQATPAGFNISRPITIIGDGVSNQGALQNVALNNTIGANVLKVGGQISNRITSASALTLTIGGITRDETQLNGVGAPLTFGGAGIITLTGVISTTGTSGLSSLTKVDAGTLNLGNLAHVYNGSTTISAGAITRSVVSGAITATGNFTTAASLAVTFTGGVPAIGSTWKFFPADTTNTYSTVALTGATGRTGSYNKTTSTLTIS
jgi:fibronectin-binding autotransporter adhesin